MLPALTKVETAPTGDFVTADKVRLVLGEDDPDAIALAVQQAVAMLEGLDSRTERFFRPVTLMATTHQYPFSYDSSLRLMGLKDVEVEIQHATIFYDNEAQIEVAGSAVKWHQWGIPYVCWRSTVGSGFEKMEVTYSPVNPVVPEDMQVAVLAYAARLLENPSSAEEMKWKEEQAVKTILDLNSARL